MRCPLEGRRLPKFARPRNRLAYAFYATSDAYAIAVLVFVSLLRKLGVRGDADLLVLHRPLPSRIVATMREMGFTTMLVPAPGRTFPFLLSEQPRQGKNFSARPIRSCVVCRRGCLTSKESRSVVRVPFPGAGRGSQRLLATSTVPDNRAYACKAVYGLLDRCTDISYEPTRSAFMIWRS
jgi:hypothetical protein